MFWWEGNTKKFQVELCENLQCLLDVGMAFVISDLKPRRESWAGDSLRVGCFNRGSLKLNYKFISTEIIEQVGHSCSWILLRW